MRTRVEELLIKMSLTFDGDYFKIIESINNKSFEEKDEIKTKLENLSSDAICLVSEQYPKYLSSSLYPPIVLYYRGDISLLANCNKNLAVIGSRECSAYGKDTTREIISHLDNDIVIVSGLAIGIDSIAHIAALDSGHKTIAVLGSGLDNCYPISNKKLMKRIIDNGGLILSEYPPDVPPNQYNFPMRNRIIAGISSVILVTEAKNRSGTEITVNRGLEAGRDIICVPYPYGSDSFCNRLIHEGAVLINGHDQVNEIMREKM